MKKLNVKVISRNPDEYLRETKKDLHKVPRNYDPTLHPFESAREYVRALNATKLERVFAKPFVGNLDGHKDGVSCFAKNPERLSNIVSGAYDGEIRCWHLPTKTCTRAVTAHDGWVRGIAFAADGQHFISIGDDKSIKMWNLEALENDEQEEDPVNTILCKSSLLSVTHHKTEPIFATCGEMCYIWEETRNEPLKSFEWGVDTLHSVHFNPIETALLATCASDRSIILYDQREANPLRKLVMTMRPNRLAWNPMSAFVFTVANEDYNLYTFDTRQLKYPTKIHMDHISAVTDVDYAPTGREFVSGSYDKTVRIYEQHASHSREVYHTKRMQHVTCIGWSLDNKYIYSGSDEMNIRLWKARAAEKLGPLQPREKAAFAYGQALKEKYAAHPQIKRIARHRQLPKHIHVETSKLKAAKQKLQRKESNRRVNSKPGVVPFVPERQKHVVKEET